MRRIDPFAVVVGVLLLGAAMIMLGADWAVVGVVLAHHHTVAGVIATIGGMLILDGFVAILVLIVGLV